MENKIKYMLLDGQEIEMELTLEKLHQLKDKKNEEYQKINSILLNGVRDIFEQVIILYTAYLCANIDKIDSCMNYEEFEKKINKKAGHLTITSNMLL